MLDRDDADRSSALTVPALLDAVATEAPATSTLGALGAEPVTFGRLVEQTRRIVGQLRTLGIRRDRVALVHREGRELTGAFLGVSSAAVCAPRSPAIWPGRWRVDVPEYVV